MRTRPGWFTRMAIAFGWALAITQPVVLADDWVLPDSRLGVRTAPLLLMTRPDVQADLALTGQQALSLQRAVADLQQRALPLKGKPDAQVLAERRAIDEAQSNWIETQLDERQRRRLEQIDLQWEGPAALISRAWVASELKLTNDQRAGITQAVSQFRARTDESTDSVVSQSSLSENVLATLSGSQREHWRSLLGRPFLVRRIDSRRPSAAAQ